MWSGILRIAELGPFVLVAVWKIPRRELLRLVTSVLPVFWKVEEAFDIYAKAHAVSVWVNRFARADCIALGKVLCESLVLTICSTHGAARIALRYPM